MHHSNGLKNSKIESLCGFLVQPWTHGFLRVRIVCTLSNGPWFHVLEGGRRTTLQYQPIHNMMIQIRRVLLTIIVICTIVGLLQNARNLSDFRGDELEWATGGAPPSPLRHPPTAEEYFWKKREEDCSSCIYADNVCSDNTGWFYAPPHDSDSRLQSYKQWNDVYQPTIKLVYDRKELATTHVYLHGLQVSEDIQFDVSSTSHIQYNDTLCSYSSVPYHLVVQSAYNEMIGEFYVRTILPLNLWMRDFPATARAAAAVEENIQTYVHFVDRRKELFHGHKLFLGGLANNNVYDNLLSLMPKKDDNSTNNCRCYRKLIFCGYKIKNITSSRNVKNSSIHDSSIENETSFIIIPGSQITNSKTENYDIHDISVDPIYDNLRKDLIDTYYRKDLHLNEKIIQYQMQMLIDKGIVLPSNGIKNISSSSSIDTVKEWKFVGLTHRKYRRVWLNIDDILSICETKFRIYKIVCILIDVENATSAEEQLLMHRSLDAIIGVHGAQLTQGILLSPHAYMLELLPWVPYYLWGGWVATTHSPTPLGIIYHRTDINHIGYPLGRDSVPLCLHVNSSDIEADQLCLMNITTGVLPKFRWADRDYIVPPNVIEDFVTTYLLKKNSNDEVKEEDYCDEMQRQADETNFVLYNVFCKMGNNSDYIAKQYYRQENWMLPKKINNAFGAVH